MSVPRAVVGGRASTPGELAAVAQLVTHRATGTDDEAMLRAMLGLAPAAKRRRGRPLAEHGTPGRYRSGCRCGDCRAAHTAKCRADRHRRAADPSTADRAGHGKANTYRNHGCRCEPCTAAHSAQIVPYLRQLRARRRTEAVR